MVNALTLLFYYFAPPAWKAPAYDEQIIARAAARVQQQPDLWFPAHARTKKEPPFPAAFEVDNREASNRVDRSHSVSKRGRLSHKRESLTDRKRAIFFRLYLPC